MSRRPALTEAAEVARRPSWSTAKTSPCRPVAEAEGRSRRVSRLKVSAQVSSAPTRLRKPVRNVMWMTSQASQPIRPATCSGPKDTTAEPREMYAAEPRSRYLNGLLRLAPDVGAVIRRAA